TVTFTSIACTSGTFHMPGVPWPDAGDAAGVMANGDFNGDHRPDLVVGKANGVNVLLARGHGLFAPPLTLSTGGQQWSLAVRDFATTPVGPAPGTSSLAIGNLDGDRFADFVIGDRDGVQPFFGGAGQSITPGELFVPHRFNNNQYNLVAIGDYDHDGKPDIA